MELRYIRSGMMYPKKLDVIQKEFPYLYDSIDGTKYLPEDYTGEILKKCYFTEVSFPEYNNSTHELTWDVQSNTWVLKNRADKIWDSNTNTWTDII